MNPVALELALKKQRLQFRCASQREDFARHAAGLAPLLDLGDRAAAGALWLRRHPQVPVAVAAALLVARPRGIFRWLRRGFLAWRTARGAQRWLEGLR